MLNIYTDKQQNYTMSDTHLTTDKSQFSVLPLPLVLRVHVRVRAVPILVFIEG